jgi:hypothetical protein
MFMSQPDASIKKRKSPLEIYEEFKKEVKKRTEERTAPTLSTLDSSELLRVRLIACEKLLEQFQQRMNAMMVDISAISASTSSFISFLDTCKYWWESSQGKSYLKPRGIQKMIDNYFLSYAFFPTANIKRA